MPTRPQSAEAAVRVACLTSARELFKRELSLYLTEIEQESLAQRLAELTANTAETNGTLRELLSENQLEDGGRINGRAIVASLQRTIESTQDAGVKGRLTHLSQHLQHTFESLGFYRETRT